MAGQRKRGFAAMSSQKQREIASKGGRAAHQKGTAHEFTVEEARAAGHRGGKAVSTDRQHMASIGRRGGQRSGEGVRSRKNGADERFGIQGNRNVYERATNGHGLSKATEFIRADHAEVQDLFYDYEVAGGELSQKQSLIYRICQELELHASLEEELFYPMVRGRLAEKGQQLVAEALTEHQSIKDLIEQLKRMRSEDISCDDLMQRLKDNVRHHVTQEEKEMLPLAEEYLGDDLMQLGLQMQQRKQQLKETVDFVQPAQEAMATDY